MRYLRVPINAALLFAPLVPLGIGGYVTARRVFDYLNTNQRLAGTLSAEATRALGRSVTVGDVKITGNLFGFTAHNEVELSDVTIAETASPNSPVLARVKRVTVGYNLQQVVSSRSDAVPIVDGIAIDSPELRLFRDAGGRWNFTPLLQKLLSGTGTSKRSLTTKITLSNARINYSDFAFPHPVGVSARPFFGVISGVGGVALVRPDKGVSFDMAGNAPPEIAGNFHAVGIVALAAPMVSARLTLENANLPVLAARLLPAPQAKIATGTANVDLSALYAPPAGTPLAAFKPAFLVAHGAVQLANLNAFAAALGGPVSNLNGSLAFTMDAAQVNLNGNYAGISARVHGSVFGLPLSEMLKGAKFSTHDLHDFYSHAAVALSGDLQNVAFARVMSIPPAAAQIGRLPANVRAELRSLRGTLTSAPFSLTGTLADPTLALTATLPAVQTRLARADNIRLNVTLANHNLSLDLRGLLGRGELGVRAVATLQNNRIGPYRIVARGRDLQLKAVQGFLSGQHSLSGTAQLDAAASGSGRLTPQIQAQAQVADIAFDENTIRSAYLDIGTSRNKLVIHNARIEDEKGYSVLNGTVDWQTRTLDLNAEADELDLEELAKIGLKFRPELAKQAAKNPDRFSVDGIAYVRGASDGPARITGTLDNPKAQTHVTAFDVRVNKLGLDQVEATLDVTKDTLIVAQGSAVHAPGTVRISGLIDGLRDKEASLSVTARADSLDLNYLLQTAGISVKGLDVTGTVSTVAPIVIAGSLTDPRIRQPFTVSLDDMTLNGLPVANAAVTANYGPQGIHLIRAGADFAGGTIAASGLLQLDGGLNVTAKATGLQIAEAATALPVGLEGFQGTADAAAAITGTLQNPEVTATVDAQKLAYNTAPLGRFQGGAIYADNTITLKKAALTDFAGQGTRFDIPALAYNLKTRAASGTANWSGITFQGFRGLLQSYADADPTISPETMRSAAQTVADFTNTAQIATNGNVRISGTLEEPQFAVHWNDTPITIGGYPLQLLAGDADINKARIRIPRTIRVTAQDGEIDVDAPSIVYDGDLQVDINAPSVNLAVLQKWLRSANPDALRGKAMLPTMRRLLAAQGRDARIGGTANFAATIRGKTRNPDITQASLNVSELNVSRLPTAEELRQIQLSLKTPRAQAGPEQNRVTVYDISRFDINDANLTGGVLNVNDAAVSIGNTQVRMKGRASGFMWQAPFFAPDAVYHAEAKLNLRDEKEQNLQEIARLFPSVLDPQSVGQITAQATADKKPDSKFSVFGKVGLEAKRLQAAGFRSGLRDVVSAFSFDGANLNVDGFSARTQIYNVGNAPENPKDSGTPISLNGSLPLSVEEGTETAKNVGLHFSVARALFAERPLPGSKTGAARGAASANLTIARAVLTPEISGNITLSDAEIAIPSDFGGLPSGTVAPPVDPHFNNLAIVIGKNARVSNALLNTVVTGNVTIDGSLAAPKLAGTLTLNGGKLALATTRLTILKPSTIRVNYPVPDAGQQGLGLYVNLQAEGFLPRASTGGRTVSERVAFRVTGPLTGDVIDPNTGQSRLSITSSNANFDQDTLLQSLTVGSNPNAIGTNPTQALSGLLQSAVTGSFLPGLFDRTAQQLGFEELSVGYDALQTLNLNITRRLFGPFSASYIRALSGVTERYTFRLSAQIQGQLQASFETDERSEQKYLIEGAWRF